jgi:two-component system sensor histidine kinase KdpD
LHGLVNLLAIGIERVRAQEKAGRLEAARQNDELKSILLDAIAHEFKTPLTSIKVASIALLADHQLKPDQTRELITVVDEEANRLRDLVTQAIQMARLEPGRVKLNPAPADLEEIIADAANKGARFQEGQLLVTVDAGLPVVNADRELIELAVRQQLIDNAVKYSIAGGPVRISASRTDDSVVVSVEGEGRSVPEAERVKIFERFYSSHSTLHNLPGAGLGLAIARDIVQAHGGTIWMEPGKSRGSIFSMSLPLKGPRTTSAPDGYWSWTTNLRSDGYCAQP